MPKKVVSFSLDQSTVDNFKEEARKYPGSKSSWANSILKEAVNCISVVGFDEFMKRLKRGEKR